MHLLIDIGNTSAKLAVMDTDIVWQERRYEPWGGTFARLMAAYPITDVRISTVAGEDEELKAALDTLGVPVPFRSLSHQARHRCACHLWGRPLGC